MVFLFVVCLLVLLEILPETYMGLPNTFGEATVLYKIFYCLILLPSDATIFNILNYNTMKLMNNLFFWHPYIMLAAFWGVFINIILYCIFRKTSVSKLFNLMYFGFLLFLLGTFLLPHHIGLLFIITIFCFWCAYDDSQNLLVIKKWQKYVIALIFAVQFYWGIYDINCDIYKDYNEAKSIAKYIQLNHLNDYKISTSFKAKKFYYSKFLSEYKFDFNDLSSAMLVNSYIGYNIFYTFNILHSQKNYIINTPISINDNQKVLNILRNNGEPDVLIVRKYEFKNEPNVEAKNNIPFMNTLEIIWGNEAKLSNYVSVKEFYHNMPFKNSNHRQIFYMYMKKDLYEKIKDRLKNK